MPPAATPIADPVKTATEACEARIAALLVKEREEEFDWIKDDSIILEKQLPIAIYSTGEIISSSGRRDGATRKTLSLSLPRRIFTNL